MLKRNKKNKKIYEYEHGIGLEPGSKAIIGSQQIPWIYEDRLAQKDVVDALLKMYNMKKEERKELGRKGREHVLKNYNFKGYVEKWIEIITKVHETHGSWDKRKKYQGWTLRKIS